MLKLLTRAVVVLIVLGSVCTAQQSTHKKRNSTGPLPTAAEHYSTTLLNNADIAIRRLNIPAGAEAPMAASTHDYLVISVGTNSVSVKGDMNSFDLDLRPGDMQVIDGGWQHAIVNRATVEAELFMIEPARNIGPKQAICGLGKKSCREHDFAETPKGTYNETLQFETETTKLYRLSMDPGVSAHLHLSGEKYLIVALTPFQGEQDSVKFHLKAGDMRWIPAGFKVLGNDGTNEVRLLILELK
jgi:mannose-6-phosphate isomerase-like protein (cupin superfamily)